MRRVISVWLPRWPIDRLRRSRSRAGHSPARPAEAAPFALVAPDRPRPVLAAVNRRAWAEGLEPGLRLADAHALLAGLATAKADPAADRRGLKRLALWCGRFTPWCAVDGDDGLVLDVTGCAHLLGGEAALVDEVAVRLEALGLENRLGLADTPGAAWALARFGAEDRRTAAPGDARTALNPLPVEALRIAPEDARLLRRLGLTTINSVDALPRSSLARRFTERERSAAVLSRLDRVLGWRAEPVSPIVPPPVCIERLTLPEPLIDRNGLDAALARLIAGLIASLERGGLGARHLVLWCYRADGSVARREVSTVRATRDGAHLLRLLAGKAETVDPGFGIDAVALHAARIEPLEHAQLPLTSDGRKHGGDVGLLLDRLRGRLGAAAVRLEPVERHPPEKAERAVAAGRDRASWPEAPDLPQRPSRLFDRPEPVEAVAEVPDGPPVQFTWRRVRRRVARAAGPERMEPEWWSGGRDRTVRDYYRVEDTGGRRYWLYRAGLYGDACTDGPPRWYLHGLYG